MLCALYIKLQFLHQRGRNSFLTKNNLLLTLKKNSLIIVKDVQKMKGRYVENEDFINITVNVVCR